jgi:ketosteroid isomerase-like protein
VEQRFTEALLKKDAVAVDELLADDLLHISFDGQVAKKAQYMAFFKEGPWQYRKYKPTNVAVKVLGNVVVVTGRVNRTIVINNNETTGAFAFTHVWSRTADRWRLTSSQVTAVPTPAPLSSRR